MKLACRSVFLMMIFFCTLPSTGTESRVDTSKIDLALGRSGTWIEGVYLVTFPRPDLSVMLQGVRLSTAHVVPFVTFMGSENNFEMMGEIFALSSEVTPAIAKLRAGGFEISGVHNHFLGELPHIMFIHFMARGHAGELAQSFRAALAVTGTPLGKAPALAVGPTPDWAKTVEKALGRPDITWFTTRLSKWACRVPISPPVQWTSGTKACSISSRVPPGELPQLVM